MAVQEVGPSPIAAVPANSTDLASGGGRRMAQIEGNTDSVGADLGRPGV